MSERKEQRQGVSIYRASDTMPMVDLRPPPIRTTKRDWPYIIGKAVFWLSSFAAAVAILGSVVQW